MSCYSEGAGGVGGGKIGNHQLIQNLKSVGEETHAFTNVLN